MSINDNFEQVKRIEELKSFISIKFNVPLAIDFVYGSECLELKPFKIENLKQRRCKDCQLKDEEEYDE